MRILIVGDLAGYLTDAAKILLTKGGKITQVSSAHSAIQMMREGHSCDLVLMDLEQNIPQFLEQLHQERIHNTVIACGVGPAEKEKVLAAIRAGAKEYIPLPPDIELIADLLEAFLEKSHNLIFQDKEMKKTLGLADRVASSDASILITGESGTGKEVMARYIHQHSSRKKQPFISLNCAAIPENLLESELFGHEKGSFTGALARRIGKFEEANGGTLLLDEISEMHPRLQAKLLRAIQEREIDRVGGSKPVKVNIRVLATSNRNMEKEITQGRFREDLFFRLNVVNIHIPALRKRPEDIIALAHYFTEKYLKINGLSPKTLTQETLETLTSYKWPGNVRELENTMHRAVLLSQEKEVLPEHLGLKTLQLDQTHPASPQVGQTLAQVEKEFILSTLDHCVGNYSEAAHLLGLSLRSLSEKLREYEKNHGLNSFSSSEALGPC